MSSGRARRLLLAAFLISLLVHLLVALVLHPTREPARREVEIVSILHRLSVTTKLRTPPPRPKATPVPHPAPTARPAPHRSAAPQGPGGSGKAVATAAPTAAPTIVPTIAANPCAQPDAPAAVTATPPPPEIPVSVRADATTGIASIQVRLDAQGAVLGTTVAGSTGNPSLDLIATAMARAATYSPALRACKPVASAYTFSVKFVAW